MVEAGSVGVKGRQRVESVEGDTRDQLLTAAGRLMTERGSTDVSLAEIAQKSGLNSALVKYYFGSKAGLLMALLRKVLGPGMEQVSHLADLPISPQDKLRVHISGVVNTYFRYPYTNGLIKHLLVEFGEEYGPMIAAEFTGPVAAVQKRILEEGAAKGIFRQVDPMLFYFHVVGACDHLFSSRYSLKHAFGVDGIDEATKRAYVDHISYTVIAGLVLQPEGGVPPENAAQLR